MKPEATSQPKTTTLEPETPMPPEERVPTPYYTADGVTLHLGNSLDVLAAMGDASVDAVVTDPPYELGFMGKAWDSSGIAYNVELWRQCWRVLKPGGHLLAFGGTRTYHRMVVAIEDAGFEIRDSLHWIYGCLTADAEILTEQGWKLGVEVQTGERVAQWDHATGSVSLAPVEQTYRAPWDGPMRVLRNADTDQVLTPNHRVYHRPRQCRMTNGRRNVWYDGPWQVAEAGDLSTWNPVQLPLAGEHDGPGIGGADYAALLGWVWTEGGFDDSGTGVRIYQSSVNADKIAEIAALMDRLGTHKRYEREREYKGRTYTETTWFFTGELAEAVRRDLPGKRPTYDLLWRMTGAEKRAMLDAALLGDGSRCNGVWQFYQQHEDDLVWLQTLLALIGRSGKVGMRPNRPGGSLYLRNGGSTELQARHLRHAREDYTGEVWCVKVPTGAFVARRNGRVFITGNSGFPKGQDIAKGIDRRRDDRARILRVTAWLAAQVEAAGWTARRINDLFGFADKATHWLTQGKAAAIPKPDQWARLREAIGFDDADIRSLVDELNARKGTAGEVWDIRPNAAHTSRPGMAQSWADGAGWTGSLARGGEAVLADAQRWQGWNTALKPAHEPIVLARKGTGFNTTVANVLEHGTGALNIDGCRTAAGQDYRDKCASVVGLDSNRNGDAYSDWTGVREDSAHDAGRWPTNILLGHGPHCVDGGDCQPGCPVADLDLQTRGMRASKPSKTGSGGKGGGSVYGGGKSIPKDGYVPVSRDDEGGASRFFPVFRYEAKAPASERPRLPDGTAHTTVKPLALMRWLVRLVTPPGGTVLEPFAGSGTTLEACVIEGMQVIGIELDEAHAQLCKIRLSKPMEPTLFGDVA